MMQPSGFYRAIAPFPPYNQHLIHSVSHLLNRIDTCPGRRAVTSHPSPVSAARLAATMLWPAIGLQLAWLLMNTVALHRHPGLDVIGAVILIVVLVFAATPQGQWRWPGVLLRVVMAADFLLAVADRFGLLGAPGSPGVSGGDFQHFTAYTRTVIAFLPAGFAHPAAVAATIAEITLGVALLFGLKTRLAAIGAGALLASYATAMSISLPAAQQFHYNVILLCAAMFALATRNPTDTGLRGTRPGVAIRWTGGTPAPARTRRLRRRPPAGPPPPPARPWAPRP